MTVELIQGLLLAFALVVILMPAYIRLLQAMGMGKRIRAEGPEAHLAKGGTPTMGGLLIIIVVIALFYTAKVSIGYLTAALAVWAALCVLNRFYRVMALVPYLAGGALMWFLMLKSGIHATIAGVMLAFAIPFSARDGDAASPSHRLEHFLHKPVAFVILPIFALANTGISIGTDWLQSLASTNSAGVIAGLVAGKPLGVTLLCLIAISTGICHLPPGLKWRHVVGAGMIGGIGFTMSIFIANLAFAGHTAAINASKMAILVASLTAGIIGFLWLRFVCKPADIDGSADAPS